MTIDLDPEIPAEEARRRFAWARRQGRPAWLWPETPILVWREAMARVAEATGALLADARHARLEGDAPAIGLAGYTSGMGPLLGCWIEQGRLQAPREVAAVLARHLAHNRLRAARMTEAAGEVTARLAERGVGPLVLKGAHTGHAYFPEPGARPASDVDLLVAADEVPAAEAVLESCGLLLNGRSRWESCWAAPDVSGEPRSLTYVHADDPWSIDLHGSLNISAGDGTALAALDAASPLASVTRWAPDRRARVLDQPLLLLHLATHAGAGWQNLTLLRQAELVLVIRQDLAAGRLSWDAFLEAGERTGAIAYVHPALRLAEALAPGVVPPAVLDATARRAPEAVLRALRRLTPATAQRIDRTSLEEHFMWAVGWRGRLRLAARDLVPAGRSLPDLRRIYEDRAWRLIRGRFSP